MIGKKLVLNKNVMKKKTKRWEKIAFIKSESAIICRLKMSGKFGKKDVRGTSGNLKIGVLWHP